MEEVKSKEFSNQEITVTYDPSICKQSALCAKELSDVFSFSIIPWINLDNTDSEKIINQIKRCPSGALKFHLHNKQAS